MTDRDAADLCHILEAIAHIEDFSGNITSAAPEAQELVALEETNTQTIGAVYDALRSDSDVGESIARIRGHEWVQVVEGKENV